MGSETAPLKLPIIDFAKPNLKPGTVEWDLVKGQVQQALQEYNCFEASFAKIPLELRGALFGALDELFDLPFEVKKRNVADKPYHGYIGQQPSVPLYESMGFKDAIVMENVDAQTRTWWPEGNPSFSETIHSFAKQVSELDQMVRRMILESFGIEKHVDEHMDSTDYLFRVNKYEGPKTGSETKVGLISHTDKNIVTILYQNDVGGLGIQSKNGEWIDVKPCKDSFIVMFGDSFHAYLNGRLNPTYHRVMMTGDRARYSVGLFSVPKVGYKIKAPEELVDEAHPLLYKPFEHAEFLRFHYSRRDEEDSRSSLKVYCGA
ncbi:Oxoglutarate/iron-dependent dioxygenase [Corchorus olitorius]|uniref:Oxoglutarate/iron-dependent dioxygenase n=1 Tax=Corchorus olitorius TaxID=93759 RepID=A0A1R3JZM8_9ROSI|nr:Oxoglutarate/iron-dependent dioxygenase [Corchorus olitorius]